MKANASMDRAVMPEGERAGHSKIDQSAEFRHPIACGDSCQFVISPVNRWDVLPFANWDIPFFAPIAIILLLGLAMGRAGFLMWRQTK